MLLMVVSIKLTWFQVVPVSRLTDRALPAPLVAAYILPVVTKSGEKRTQVSAAPVGTLVLNVQLVPPSRLIKVRELAAAPAARMTVLSLL